MMFIDDILAYSRSEKEHEEHLHLVLHEVAFLGHIISKGGISVDLSKIQNVLSWNLPMSVGDILSFLGLAGYYWRFMEGF
jgi:hypothetical protein